MSAFNQKVVLVDFTAAGAGATEILAAAAGKRYGVICAVITADTVGMNPRFEDTGGDDLTGPFYMAANAGFVIPERASGQPWFRGTKGENLQINVAAAGKVGGFVVVEEGSY
jgi:hypothetical protein